MCIKHTPTPASAAHARGAGGTQGIHVVDDAGTRCGGCGHYLRFAGIDGHGDVQGPCDALDDGHDTRYFDCGLYALRARTGRLSAHIEYAGPLSDHGSCAFQRGVTMRIAPAVRKGVRRDIEYPHHHGTAQVDDTIETTPIHET